jgi:hypothetical protein
MEKCRRCFRRPKTQAGRSLKLQACAFEAIQGQLPPETEGLAAYQARKKQPAFPRWEVESWACLKSEIPNPPHRHWSTAVQMATRCWYRCGALWCTVVHCGTGAPHVVACSAEILDRQKPITMNSPSDVATSDSTCCRVCRIGGRTWTVPYAVLVEMHKRCNKWPRGED